VHPVGVLPNPDQAGEYHQSHDGEQNSGCDPALPRIQMAQRYRRQQGQRSELQLGMRGVQVQTAAASCRTGQQPAAEREEVPGIAAAGRVHKRPQRAPGRQQLPDGAAAQPSFMPAASKRRPQRCPGGRPVSLGMIGDGQVDERSRHQCPSLTLLLAGTWLLA